MIILSDIEYGWSEGDKLIIKTYSLKRENIYAGAIVSRGAAAVYTERKILFAKQPAVSKNANYEYTEDLLYESPSYEITQNINKLNFGEYAIYDVVKLGALLEHLGFNEILNERDIAKIYRLCLNPNSILFKQNYEHLPINFDEYALLEKLSSLSKKPSIYEVEKYKKTDSFKKKVKTYTFK